MKMAPVNSTVIFIMTLAMINHYGQYVKGAGYQTDHSVEGNDNNDKAGSANYRFEYGVDDGSAGQQFGHEEERNGYLTRGRYSVLLPDGRLQVVTYRADQNGYKADVTYEKGLGADSSRGGYNSATGNSNGGGGHGYENVETSAASYGPPVSPTQNNYGKGNSGKDSFKRVGDIFGKGSSRTFVKLRRTVDGRMFNYAY